MDAGYAGRRRKGFGEVAHAGEHGGTRTSPGQPCRSSASPRCQKVSRANRFDDPGTTSRSPDLHLGLSPRLRLRPCPCLPLCLPLCLGLHLRSCLRLCLGLHLCLCIGRCLCLHLHLHLRLGLCPPRKRLVQPNHSGGPRTAPASSNQHRRHRAPATGRRSAQDKHFGAPGETLGVLGIPRRHIGLMWWSVY